jgi:hypothetical protein
MDWDRERNRKKSEEFAQRLFRDFAEKAKREGIPADQIHETAWQYFEEFRAAVMQRVDEIDAASGGPPRGRG